MRQSCRHVIVLGLAAICGTACKGHRAPPTTDYDAAAAVAAGAPRPSLSHFNVPLAYDFTDMIDVVERAVPMSFGSLDSIQNIGTTSTERFAYEATRGGFTAFAEGAQVHLRATFSYTVRAYLKTPVGTLGAGCGTHTDRPKVIVELVAPLTVSPSWHLRSRANISSVGAPENDRGCKISFFKYNITGRVVEAALKTIAGRLTYIDGQVADVDLTPDATGWWTSLSQPIQLGDSTWLVLHPARFQLRGVTGTGHVLTVQAGLDAYPMIVTGKEPHVDVAALAPLASDTATPGFRIAINGSMDYGAVTRTITKSMHGSVLKQSGHSVTVESIIASPTADGRLSLLVKFTGDANGSIRLVGTPRHNAAIRQIVMPDLEYDLKTSNNILRVYAWLHSKAILDGLREHARFPADAVLDHGRDLLSKGLNRKVGRSMTLSANVDSVSVNGIYVTPSGLVIRAIGWGDAKAVVVARSQITASNEQRVCERSKGVGKGEGCRGK